MTLQELCQLYRVSVKIPQLEDALRAHEGHHAQLLADRCGGGAGACFVSRLQG